MTVKTQPTNPSQTCAVANGTGTVTSANVASVAVTCTTSSFSVAAAVSGLISSGLVLQNNGGDDLPITVNGNASFATAVASGAAYAVTKAQPANPGQTCVVVQGSGHVGGTNATITVVCTISPPLRLRLGIF